MAAHSTDPLIYKGIRVESGAQSGPESAATDRGLPITATKDVTG